MTIMHGRIAYRTSIIAAGALGCTAFAVQARSLQRPHDAAVHACAEREERSYRHYIEARAGDYRAFFQLSPCEQRAYWNWRLTHEDEL